jgi:formate dehydrogenase iron-sulfur subunit
VTAGLIQKASTGGFNIYGEKDLNGLGVMFALKDDPEAYNLPKPEYNASIALWDSFLRPLTALGFGAVAAAALVHYVTVGPKEVEPEEKEGGN